MIPVLISLLLLIVGFAGLIWSADKFVLGASTTARNLGVSPLVIGMTIVAFGTSAPEIFTSAVAALQGVPELAVGNAMGSNIANIGLVLSITALVCPVIIPVSLLKKELPALLLVTITCFFIFIDFRLNWVDGLILFLILGFFGWRLFQDRAKNSAAGLIEDDEVTEYIIATSTPKALGLMLLGLTLMIISSNILVSGARDIASALGVSDLIIGLTVVAIGTSLPELAASITSALKGHHELAVGNIVGSNILNLLLVLPVPAFLAPLDLSSAMVWRDYMSMLGLTLAFALLVYIQVKNNGTIGRKSGIVFLLLYLSYTGLLILTQ